MQGTSNSASHFDSSALANFFTPLRFASLLIFLLIISFPDVLIFGQSFVFRDFGLFNYPLAFYTRDSIWRGEIPLWNPYNNCGLPFVAQWNTQVFYPLSWIYILIPLPWSLSFFCLFHLFLAGMGMYFLLVRWTGNRFAAALGGLAFTFNGFMLCSLMWPHYMASLGLVPWTILTVEKAWREGGRTIVTAAIVAAAQLLGGGPEIVLLTWLLLFGLCLVDTWKQNAVMVKALVRFAAIVAIVAALCAVQVLPFLQLLANSQRGGGFSSTGWPMTWFGLGNFLVPLFRADQTSAGVYLPYNQAFTSSYYPGIGTLALAVISVWRIRDRRVLFFGIAALCCVIFALGDQIFIYKWLQKVFPLFSLMRYPIKFVIPLTFLFPILLAYCTRNALDSSGIPRLRRSLQIVGTVGGLLILVLLGISHTYPYKEEAWTVTLNNGITRLIFLIAGLVLFYKLATTRLEKRQLLFGIGLIGLLWLDSYTHVPRQNPVVKGEVYAPGLEVLHNLHPQPGLGSSRFFIRPEKWHEMHSRILSDPFNSYLCYRLGAFDNCNILDHLPKTDGIYSMYLRHESDVRINIFQISEDVMPVLNFLSVSQMSARDKLFEWESNSGAMPMITGGQQPVFVESTNSLSAFFTHDFNPRKLVLLPMEVKSQIGVTNGTSVKITNQTWKAHHISFDTESKADAIVVLSQTYYRPWTALVDGKETPVLKANHAFQALQIPAGNHHVDVVYRDKLFFIGALISALALAGCILGFVRSPKPAT